MDRELSSFERSMESPSPFSARNVVALQLPIGTKRFSRRDRSRSHEGPHVQARCDGKPSIRRNPAASADEAKARHEKLVENGLAEGRTTINEEFFPRSTIPIEDDPRRPQSIVAEKIFSSPDGFRAPQRRPPASCSPSSPTSFRIPTSIRRSAQRAQGQGDRIERK